MSTANSASNAMTAFLLLSLERAKRLASRAIAAVASAVLCRALRRAHRELAALDDRVLADMGLDRAAVENLAMTNLDVWR